MPLAITLGKSIVLPSVLYAILTDAMEPSTAIVTFRREPSRIAEAVNSDGDEPGTSSRRRDALQYRIAAAVQREGRYWISAAPLPGGAALRMNVISYLTDESILDSLLEYLSDLAEAQKV